MAELSQESEGQDYPANAPGRADGWRQPPADRAGGARGTPVPPASLEDSTTTAQASLHVPSLLKPAHDMRMLYCAHCGAKKRITLRCKGRTCPDCRRSEYWRLIKSYEGLVDRMVNAKHAIFTIPNVTRLTRSVILFLTRSIKEAVSAEVLSRAGPGRPPGH